ncbi:ATP-binding protein [Tundrisphaera lichenicola]|uniref:ATP-binding protein n=1 Tax=Tundrisphaera lichenicola TaxID=2029860 RepID=UPI003EBD2B81
MSRNLLGEAGIDCEVYFKLDDFRRVIEVGCGGLLLTEEAIRDENYHRLIETLNEQPTWSDLPVIMLTRGGADSPQAARALATLGNVIVLEQPVRVSTLISAVNMALRARRRQYQIREHLRGLKEADRRKDEFLAMLAHELRNPLASVNSAVRLLRGPDGPEHLEWSGEVIERQVRHLARLIDDLLDISRITRGRIELRTKILDASPILNQAVDSVRPLIEERDHQLTVSYRPGNLWIEADPTRFEQIMVNLLTNAAKYTQAGGNIKLTARAEAEEVVIRVRDDGVGISSDQLTQIFELFAQGDRSLARSEGGLGIGLTLVRALVELHGGSITAESEGEGRGSQFIVRFPLAELPILSAPIEQDPGAMRSEMRVLVVDDNVDSTIGLAKLLKTLGHDVQVAHSGPEGIERARECKPDVLLLDIGLPGMDGYAVASLLRREGFDKTLIIAVSGYGQDQDRQRSKESGFDHHLIKPVDYDSLLALLNHPASAG